MNILRKIREWLNRDIEITIIDFRRVKRRKEEPIKLEGFVEDSVKRKPYRPSHTAASFAVTAPEGWFLKIGWFEENRKVETKLVRLNDSEKHVILICSPEDSP